MGLLSEVLQQRDLLPAIVFNFSRNGCDSFLRILVQYRSLTAL